MTPFITSLSNSPRTWFKLQLADSLLTSLPQRLFTVSSDGFSHSNTIASTSGNGVCAGQSQMDQLCFWLASPWESQRYQLSAVSPSLWDLGVISMFLWNHLTHNVLFLLRCLWLPSLSLWNAFPLNSSSANTQVALRTLKEFTSTVN